jgi:malate dehydrogenase (oxaloacetate-decarboxylating)
MDEPAPAALTLLGDALGNHGVAFTDEERSRLGLRGLLPYAVEDIEQQVTRSYAAVKAEPDDLAKHVNLRALQDRNETLFYRLMSEHIEEMLPIVYTPTVGRACQRFSEIYRRPRGLFIAYPDRDRLAETLRNRPRRDIDVIVVTDGQRILGLGDQGLGGMGIPIGKLSLYTALGGIAPGRTLPILLDVGTDNVELLDDPMYLGWRHPRIDGADYDAFVDAFVAAVCAELPAVLLQWEDFATPHALPILERYRDQLLTFNDDIQGTAAVALAALTAGVIATGSRMRDQRLVMLGAGSAGLGVCEQIVRAMVTDGLSDAEARARIYLVDVEGLVSSDRKNLDAAQRRLAQPPMSADPDRYPGLLEVVTAVQPTALIGLSTAAGAFTEPVVRRMAQTAARPIIMPLSNPTSRSEARPRT